MQCKSFMVLVDRAEDGKPFVSMLVGNRRSGKFFEVACGELTVTSARDLAERLLKAADEAQRLQTENGN